MNTNAIIFDLDGTLVDTERYILDAFNYALETKGFPKISSKYLYESSGLKMTSIYREVTKLEDVDGFVKLHQEFQRNNLALVKPYNGVQEVLQELAEKKVKISIATSRFRKNTEVLLEMFSWEKFFVAVACGDDGFKEKPDPEMFSWCARKMGVERNECLVIGDAVRDMQAGKAMGAKTCRAAYGYAGKEEDAQNTDFVAKKPSDILEIMLKEH